MTQQKKQQPTTEQEPVLTWKQLSILLGTVFTLIFIFGLWHYWDEAIQEAVDCDTLSLEYQVAPEMLATLTEQKRCAALDLSPVERSSGMIFHVYCPEGVLPPSADSLEIPTHRLKEFGIANKDPLSAGNSD